MIVTAIVAVMDGTAIEYCIERAVALRSIEIEHQRRDDWRQRQASAAAFVRVPLRRGLADDG